jgi:hypothetical protein
MSVKLCLLKTGQTVIGDLKEVIDHAENKCLGYKICNPYVVDFEFKNTLQVEGEEKVTTSDEDNAGIKFSCWSPLAAERDFNFPYEFIDVIYEPHRDVVRSYNTVVNHVIDENTVTQFIDGKDVILTYNQNLEESVTEINRQRESEINSLEEGELHGI